MFSVAEQLYSTFLLMLPVQILLNNLLYDISQSTITTDKVDEEYIERPKRWDMTFIKRFMISLGPVSSLFDFLTFFIMLYIFNAEPALFRTAWFVESIITAVIVVFVIRTRRRPFWKSKPSRYLIFSSIAIIVFALIVPNTPLGQIFGFVPLPPLFFGILILIIGAYVILAEVIKGYFYKRHAYRLEQVLVPKRALYVTKTAKLMQDMIAAISLRSEDEFTIESLNDDLNHALSYPINFNQVARNLQYLRRSNLISVDWKERTIKRETSLSEYVQKSIINGPMWEKISNEWLRINSLLLNKYGTVNTEYEDLLPKQ